MRVYTARMNQTFHDLLKKLYEKQIKYQPVEKLLRPKHIAVPGGYAALTEAAALPHQGIIFGYQIAQSYRNGNPEPANLRHTVVTTSYMTIREGMPIYYTSEDFIRAVAATALPEDIRIEELKWPREAFILALPTRFMREYIGQDISYLQVTNTKAGEYSLKPMINDLPTMCPPKNKFCVHTMIWNKDHIENALVAWWQDDVLAQAATRWTYTDMCGSDEATVKYKRETNDLLGNLVLKLLLILSMRPEMIVEGAKIRDEKRDHKGRIEQVELWAPNTIGWDYRILESPNKEGDDGTHGLREYSPHQGWIKRSGHITHQFVGKRDVDLVSTKSLPKLSTGEIDWSLVPKEIQERFWAQHERRWIEPIWYNPAEAK